MSAERWRRALGRATAAGVAAAVLAGCVPEFVNGLPPPAPPAVDPAMAGVWSSVSEQGQVSLLVLQPRPSGRLNALSIGHVNSEEPGRQTELSVFEGYTATVGDERFLCIRKAGKEPPAEEKGEPGYLLSRYALETNGGLALTLFSLAKTKELIQGGALAGTIEEGKFGGRVTVTSPAEAVAAVLRERGVSAFVDEKAAIRFRRVGAAP